MGNVITNLKAKFGVDTSDFKKGLKDGERAVSDFKGAASNQIEQFASMFGINMSAVSDSISTAGKSLNFVGQSFKGAAAGGNVFKVAINGVKLALASSGIGLIVLALGSLVAYFQKSGRGADQFAKILAQVKSVINNVIDRLAVFGKGVYEIATGKFKQGWETMKGAFQGIGQEIKNDWIAAGELADRLDALDDKEIQLITSLEERRAKAAELRLMAKEETEDQKKILGYLQEAERLYKSVYGDLIAVETERLAIMKEQLAISASDPTDEQRREVAEQEAKIASLMRQQAEELKSLNREKRKATEVVKEELDLEVKKLQTLQLIDDKANISNIKMPDFSQVSNALASLRQTKEAIGGISIDISGVLEDTFENITAGFAELAGRMAVSSEGMRGWGTQFVATAFGDMLINLGKVAIGTGITIESIKAAFKSLGGIGAIAAGSALIVLGAAIKAKVQATFSSSPSAVSSSGSSASFGSSSASQQPITINLTGKLVAEGGALVAVINQENIRRKVST